MTGSCHPLGVWGFVGRLFLEPCLGHLSLVHAKAPEREKLDVGVDVALVEFLLSVVRVDVRLPGRPCGNDERKGGEGVRCEDRIAKEGSGDEARERP